MIDAENKKHLGLEVVEKLADLFGDIADQEFTGQIRFNFHKGRLSEKVERKDFIKL